MREGPRPAERPARAAEGRPGAPAARPTGHARVDAVLARVPGLGTTPVAEHAELYEAVHAALAAELDAEPDTVPAGLVPRTDELPREPGDQ